MARHKTFRTTVLLDVAASELIEIARWHVVRWSSGQSGFDRSRAKRRTWTCGTRPQGSHRIAEFGALENSDATDLSVRSDAPH